jgi:hypothetical protein
VILQIIMKKGFMLMMKGIITLTFSPALVFLSRVKFQNQDKNYKLRKLIQETLLWYVDPQNQAIWEILLWEIKIIIILFTHLLEILGLKVFKIHLEVQNLTILNQKQAAYQDFKEKELHSNLTTKHIKQIRVQMILL